MEDTELGILGEGGLRLSVASGVNIGPESSYLIYQEPAMCSQGLIHSLIKRELGTRIVPIELSNSKNVYITRLKNI